MEFKEWKQILRDKTELQMYEWKPKNLSAVKGVIQLVHGSCEHALRYQEFAEYLVAHHYIVIASDHRGHGKTALAKEDLGFFAEDNGWEKLIEDLNEVTTYIKKHYPELPIMMFGHSMGSFMVRHYAMLYGDNLAALVVCGTAHHKKGLLKFSAHLAEKHQKKYGPKAKDQFIYNLSYAPLNKKFRKEGKSGTEWLSSDLKVQEKFQRDPLAGQIFSTSAFKDMFNGLIFITNTKNIAKTPNKLPLLFIAGKDDPVGNFGKSVKKTFKLYKKHHCNDEIKLYPGARHEILNEKIKKEVMDDILKFYDKHLPVKK
ncbi:alpha/beta fold hydrolase [Spiroplasma chrysopicola]|uniref:Lysophospholipase n=1 Tax=Spiroplasma chrysopicola DF-1 TaxID=1276227 RepID=R4UGN4_9MOLU|nr:alpha/beta fold hydrolase [Spiroplasma chrysopicola]AGM25295.1 lysophospholipase [Spiroplasma chrysopicola DF-1]